MDLPIDPVDRRTGTPGRRDDEAGPTRDGGGTRVVFAATIDAVEYGAGPDSWSSISGWDVSLPLGLSPVRYWDGAGFNYWEPNGYAGLGYIGHIVGINMPNATNYEFSSDTHSSIAVNPVVLSGVERNLDDVFFSLSF